MRVDPPVALRRRIAPAEAEDPEAAPDRIFDQDASRREIEEVLYQHPAVREAAVVGIPHALLGEEVGAAIVLVPGAAITPEELRQYVKDQVAGYKYPRHIWFLDELPKTATGEILKRSITARPQLLAQGPRPHRAAPLSVHSL